MTESPPESAVWDALESVTHPVMGEDIVTLGLVRAIEVSDGRARFDLAMNTPFAPAEQAIGEAIVDIGEVLELTVDINAGIEPDPNDTLPEVRNVIVVAAGKGGVGKTTVAVNLAAGLADRGARVGLLDADVHGPNVPRALPIDSAPDLTPGDKIIPPTVNGIAVISMGMLLRDDDDPVILRGPMVNDIRTHFIDEVAWGPLDYLIIDLPPGTGDGSLDVLQTLRITGAVVVTTPHPMAHDDTRKALNMLQRHETPLLGVIENMQTATCPHCGEEHAPLGDESVDSITEHFDTALLGGLPIHPAIGTATEPVAWDPSNPCFEPIDDLVDTIVDRVSVANVRRISDTLESPEIPHR